MGVFQAPRSVSVGSVHFAFHFRGRGYIKAGRGSRSASLGSRDLQARERATGGGVGNGRLLIVALEIARLRVFRARLYVCVG
jgi:hypothetical protein